MALEATHIRYALDVRDKYEVKDIQKYISGAIYPDSRYVTKIDRNLTHPEDFMEWDVLKLDDFRKGWFIHLLYDKIQWKITMKKFPEIFASADTSQGGERWVKHTALKILQDIDDCKKYDLIKYLGYLDYVENLCGENIEKLKEYNNIFQKMYANPEKVNINSCYEMWKKFGIGDELANKVKEAAEFYSTDVDTIKLVSQIYPETLIKDLETL